MTPNQQGRVWLASIPKAYKVMAQLIVIEVIPLTYQVVPKTWKWKYVQPRMMWSHFLQGSWLQTGGNSVLQRAYGGDTKK
jgi:hypothetical protein